jgi:hypothetical protein
VVKTSDDGPGRAYGFPEVGTAVFIGVGAVMEMLVSTDRRLLFQRVLIEFSSSESIEPT